ncbi:hypothetical protein IPM09_00190 [Candidatus Saccharibacteria bacterium]|nr:MAG: hypothetical protein IPM09_00190 [Candidatus Saccharibacteria bacterium]
MEQLHKLETMIAGWMKDLPHLPRNFTKWLAENAWWLVIIGVALGVLALMTTLSAMTVGSAVLGALGAPVLGGAFLISSVVSLVGAGISVVVEAMAISPLKTMQKKGWDLLFLSTLVSFAGAVVSSLVSVNIIGVVWAALAAAISFYILLEVKSYFGAKAKLAEKSAE